MTTTTHYRIRGAFGVPNILALRRVGFDAWGCSLWYFLLTVEDATVTGGTVSGPPGVNDDDRAAQVALTHIIERSAADPDVRRWHRTHAAHLAVALFDDEGHPIPTLAAYRTTGGDPPTTTTS